MTPEAGSPSSLWTVESADESLVALLEEMRAERPARLVSVFDHAVARRIGRAACDLAERDALPVAICVMRGSQRAFHAAFEGTTAEHDDWLRRKVNTVLHHEVPSLEVVVRHAISGRAPEWLDPLEFAVAGGAVPIVRDGNVVGVVAVSGLVHSMRADHDLAMAALVAATASS